MDRIIEYFNRNTFFAKSPDWWKKCRVWCAWSCLCMPMVWLMCGFAYDSGGKWLEKDFVVAVICTYPFWIFPLNFIVFLVYRIVRVKYIAWLAYLLPIPFTYAGLDYIGSHVFGSDCYNPNDPRIFYYTPAKDIVDAMMKEDTLTVKKILQVSPQLAYYVEEYHKESLFFFAFWHGKYASVRTMIRMGVSPNICDARDKVLLEHLVTDSVSEKKAQGRLSVDSPTLTNQIS